ncbi:hypothetical protein D3C73_852060 [compost metagenome]
MTLCATPLACRAADTVPTPVPTGCACADSIQLNSWTACRYPRVRSPIPKSSHGTLSGLPYCVARHPRFMARRRQVACSTWSAAVRRLKAPTRLNCRQVAMSTSKSTSTAPARSMTKAGFYTASAASCGTATRQSIIFQTSATTSRQA